jgi:hypothetical protein
MVERALFYLSMAAGFCALLFIAGQVVGAF